jgi:hypothetical protein
MAIIVLSADNERELELVLNQWVADPYYYKVDVVRDDVSGKHSTVWTKTDLAGTITVNETNMEMYPGKYSLMIRYTVS